MENPLIVVKAGYDDAAAVWLVEWSDLPGLNIEADSLEGLRAKLPGAVLDLLEAQGGGPVFDVPIELIAHASARATTRSAA